MRTMHIWYLVSAIQGVWLGGCTTQPQNLVNDPADRTRYVDRIVRFAEGLHEIDGLALKVSLPAVSVVEAPIPIMITLSNNSNLTGEYIIPRPLTPPAAFGLRVTAERGEPVLTEHGQEVFRGPLILSGPSTYLAPGDSDAWRFDLADLFVLPPGRYRLRVRQEAGLGMPRIDRVQAKTLDLEIRDIEFVVEPDPYGGRARLSADEHWKFFIVPGDQPARNEASSR